MDSSSDSDSESDIGDIGDVARQQIVNAARKQIIYFWDKGRDLRASARETGRSLKEVSEILKLRQKRFVKKGVKKR